MLASKWIPLLIAFSSFNFHLLRYKKLLFISGMTTRGETRERERERQQFLDDAKKAGDVCELASVERASGERDIQ